MKENTKKIMSVKKSGFEYLYLLNVLISIKAVKMGNVKCWKLSVFVRSIRYSASVTVRSFNTTWKDLLILKGLINPYKTRYVLIP